MASGDKVYIADKATLDEVNGKIGSTTDTGASSSVGTMMAKENAVLTEVGKIGATDDAQSSSTTTGSIFAKLNYLVSKMVSIYSWLNSMYSKIGSTTDTGGTSTAGTIMAKENAVLTAVNKIGDTTDIGGTFDSGSLMAKVNKVINLSEKYVEVQKSKSTIVQVSKISGEEIDFSVAFLDPVKFEYLSIILSDITGDNVDYLSIAGSLRITYYDDTTKTVTLDSTSFGQRWYKKYFLYLGKFFNTVQSSYGQYAPNRVSSTTNDIVLTVNNTPVSDTTYVKKVEVLSARVGYATNIVENVATTTLTVYYRESVKFS